MEERLSYQDSLDTLSDIPCSWVDVLRLKARYSDGIISSARLEERISTLPDLLRVLAKRDELNVQVVRDIERRLRPTVEMSMPQRIVDNDQPRPPVFNALPSILSDRIFQIISEDIGRKWKELARALKIKEGQIDELEARHRSIGDRVLEFLRYHKNTCDRRRWRTELVEALSRARRNDLGEKVSHEFDIRC